MAQRARRQPPPHTHRRGGRQENKTHHPCRPQFVSRGGRGVRSTANRRWEAGDATSRLSLRTCQRRQWRRSPVRSVVRQSGAQQGNRAECQAGLGHSRRAQGVCARVRLSMAAQLHSHSTASSPSTARPLLTILWPKRTWRRPRARSPPSSNGPPLLRRSRSWRTWRRSGCAVKTNYASPACQWPQLEPEAGGRARHRCHAVGAGVCALSAHMFTRLQAYLARRNSGQLQPRKPNVRTGIDRWTCTPRTCPALIILFLPILG